MVSSFAVSLPVLDADAADLVAAQRTDASREERIPTTTGWCLGPSVTSISVLFQGAPREARIGLLAKR